MGTNNFQGELTDISAKKEALDRVCACTVRGHEEQCFFIAEISVRSPRKLFIFIIEKYICRMKVSKKNNNLILEKTSLLSTAETSSPTLRENLSRSTIALCNVNISFGSKYPRQVLQRTMLLI